MSGDPTATTTPADPVVWQDSVILAPLTKGGNLPFRRWCVDGGARITMSEMAYARQVVKGTGSELALLRKHDSEGCFGVQLAASKPQAAIDAAKRAVDRGAVFVDINAGCPIHDVVRRGMGATLLQRPSAFARMVQAMVEALDVPVTVKIRTGWNEDKINASEVARLMEEAGVAALTVHGRTREQRYSKSADWELIGQIVQERTIPIIGNGDILTWYEARDRKELSGCAGLMLARGALIKPWLFQEIAEQRDILPTTVERVAMLMRFVGYLKEHFRTDDKGRTRALRFLPWHLDFLARYRPYPVEKYEEIARRHPLMQSRLEGDEEPEAPDGPVERVLRDAREDVHQRLAEELWDADDADDAWRRIEAVAVDFPDAGEAGQEAAEVRTSHG